MTDQTDTIALTGRILFLANDPAVIEAQLAGADISLAEAGPLRTDISTDEITPLPSLLNFDATLGRHAHTGFKAGDRQPIGENALIDANVQVIVGGIRYGKGSSREHSPLAERYAGVRLVIAESFERLYRQNCDNIGLLTSTDFSLIERIQRGEAIALADIVAGRDRLAARVIRGGGLLAYGKAHLSNVASAAEGAEAARPMTFVEKIVARHALGAEGERWDRAQGTGGFVRADRRFIHEIYTGMVDAMLTDQFGADYQLHDPSTILCFEDHLSYAHRSPRHASRQMQAGVRRLSDSHRAFVTRHGLVNHGYLEGLEGSEGISHAMMAERYALPGELIVGTDSHTPHVGAIGAFAYGVGTTDMANAFMTGAARLTMPETLRVLLEGTLPSGLSAKDVVLHILVDPRIKAGAGVGRVFEFDGPVLRAMTTDERATLTNMTAEMGGLTGIVSPDSETVSFVAERRGVTLTLDDWMTSDEGAAFAGTLAFDCSALAPMVAAPGDPGNGRPLNEVAERPRIDIAYGGSCTAGKRADFDEYYKVLRWAADNGFTVPDTVTLYLQCGTTDVRDYCEANGYFDAFRAVGAEWLQPACGACGQCGPGISTNSGQVTVSAINRNFPGRGGPGSVWLASPATVAASAIAGELISFAELRARVE